MSIIKIPVKTINEIDFDSSDQLQMFYKMLEKVHPTWLEEFFSKPQVFDNLAQIIKTIHEDKFTPKAESIFETLMIDPKTVKVVIIGQDPYPLSGHANGLCFSTTSKGIAESGMPKSLVPVLQAMGNNNPLAYDFHNLLYQGVLMLNTALTTVVGQTKSHVSTWNFLVPALINYIVSSFTPSESVPTLTFMLWGVDAGKTINMLNNHPKKDNCTFLQWSHPSPMADNKLDEESKFKNCNHFTLTPQINWLLPGTKTVIYTDGAVRGVQTDDPVASWAFLIGTGPLKDIFARGRVVPNKYLLHDNWTLVTDPTETITPTSQRGEYIAMCYALLACIRLNIPSPIEIISDSNNTINLLKEWITARSSAGTLSELKNLDIVEPMYTMYIHLVETKESFKLSHIKSHQRESKDAAENKDIIYNNMVDSLAQVAKNADHLEIETNATKIKMF